MSKLKVSKIHKTLEIKAIGDPDYDLPLRRSSRISPWSIFGVSSQLMNWLRFTNLKASSGTLVMSVLSQMIPDNVRLIRVCLASLVKLPAWFLWVKKNRSPFLDLKNWLSKKWKNHANWWQILACAKIKVICHFFKHF